MYPGRRSRRRGLDDEGRPDATWPRWPPSERCCGALQGADPPELIAGAGWERLVALANRLPECATDRQFGSEFALSAAAGAAGQRRSVKQLEFVVYCSSDQPWRGCGLRSAAAPHLFDATSELALDRGVLQARRHATRCRHLAEAARAEPPGSRADLCPNLVHPKAALHIGQPCGRFTSGTLSG